MNFDIKHNITGYTTSKYAYDAKGNTIGKAADASAASGLSGIAAASGFHAISIDDIIKQFTSGNLEFEELCVALNKHGIKQITYPMYSYTTTDVTFTYNGKKYTISCLNQDMKSQTDNAERDVFSITDLTKTYGFESWQIPVYFNTVGTENKVDKFFTLKDGYSINSLSSEIKKANSAIKRNKIPIFSSTDNALKYVRAKIAYMESNNQDTTSFQLTYKVGKQEYTFKNNQLPKVLDKSYKLKDERAKALNLRWDSQRMSYYGSGGRYEWNPYRQDYVLAANGKTDEFYLVEFYGYNYTETPGIYEHKGKYYRLDMERIQNGNYGIDNKNFGNGGIFVEIPLTPEGKLEFEGLKYFETQEEAQNYATQKFTELFNKHPELKTMQNSGQLASFKFECLLSNGKHCLFTAEQFYLKLNSPNDEVPYTGVHIDSNNCKAQLISHYDSNANLRVARGSKLTFLRSVSDSQYLSYLKTGLFNDGSGTERLLPINLVKRLVSAGKMKKSSPMDFKFYSQAEPVTIDGKKVYPEIKFTLIMDELDGVELIYSKETTGVETGFYADDSGNRYQLKNGKLVKVNAGTVSERNKETSFNDYVTGLGFDDNLRSIYNNNTNFTRPANYIGQVYSIIEKLKTTVKEYYIIKNGSEAGFETAYFKSRTEAMNKYVVWSKNKSTFTTNCRNLIDGFLSEFQKYLN